jgi:muramoyltetrapeptide carboxypeptidase
MIMSLLGTEYFPRSSGGILFLEDIAEHPYRVERMLLQLMQAGVLARQQAIVLGDFSGYRLAPADNGYDFDEMLAYLRATLPCPVLTGLEFGHIPRRVTIPFGAQGRLVSDRREYPLAPDDVRLSRPAEDRSADRGKLSSAAGAPITPLSVMKRSAPNGKIRG